MYVKKKLMLWLAVFALAMPLMLAGTAGAMYLTDGTKSSGTGTATVYSNPNDGMCVVGLKFDGTLDVNASITNFKDCIVYTTPTISALLQTACTGSTGNDGYKHTWSTSICVDGSGNPISRVDVDNTVPMCTAKGGTIKTTGLCVAYGWQYRGVKADGSVPAATPKGPVDADNLGRCYTAMRMTSANNYIFSALTSTVSDACPSYHNSSTVVSYGSNTAARDAEWVAGTDGVLYQTQASYDAGLGWSYASNQCVYAYGRNGIANAAVVKADGTNLVAAGASVDMTQFTTMGDCLANGGSWDNWLPYGTGSGSGGNASTVSVPTTVASSIVKLDATTSVASGGGKFYSGTGSVCLKCHSDQSRNTIERDKPSYVKTGHRTSGDNAPWTAIGTDWGLKGVQCEVCHATGKPTRQDVGVIINSNRTGTNAGVPRAASGHNQTEYGSHVTGVCYYCHSTKNSTPATVIPVADNAKSLANITNMFLNSPHAQYTGNGDTVEVVSKANYGSTFVGNVCRTGTVTASVLSGGVVVSKSTDTVNCVSLGGVVGGSTCYATATTCATLPGGKFFTAYDVVTYPTATWGGGVCAWPGNGTILATYWNGTAAKKISFNDSAINSTCTGTGTSGAAGFWVNEGEAPNTLNGVVYAVSNQGNCMTCHDVHYSLDDTAAGAEPLRRECTTCHSAPGSKANSLSSAPQVSIINHPMTAGTPFDTNVGASPCEVCHMPKAGSQAAHLWRISSDASYTTLGATNVNLDSNNVAWLDIDLACGQCHGGSMGSGAVTNGAPFRDKIELASSTANMHGNVPLVRFTYSNSTTTSYLVNFDGSSTSCPSGSCSYAWDFGDLTSGSSVTTSHQYAGNTPVAVKLTVTNGLLVSSVTHTVVPFIVNHAPVALGLRDTYTGTTTLNPTPITNAGMTASFTDRSTDQDNNVKAVTVMWGDGAISTQAATGGVFTHNYTKVGTFTITHTVTDTAGKGNTEKATVKLVPPVVTVTGTITDINTGKNLSGVTVKMTKGTAVRTATTGFTGKFQFTRTLPGTYTITATKLNYTFNGSPTTISAPTVSIVTGITGSHN
jgi:hypothetical protein